mmetsp:Transcript_49967/g.87956  ORF Transcript_49967/g.87956 Transcript_49967/m.87956 type:complete len:614 (+) Transcript_49967:105-1946(+)
MVNRAAKQITLTKKQAFALCRDLLYGFSSADFQKQLRELMDGRRGVRGHLQGRSELAFTVQSRVLPKYGIPGTEAGVQMMFDVIYPLLDDPSMHQMRGLIEDKLGMNVETSVDKVMSLFRIDGVQDLSVDDSDSDSDSDSDTQGNMKALTKEEALSITKELAEGFSTPDFQKMLQKSSPEDAAYRKQAALTVQETVLPKYGIPGTSDGVQFMLTGIAEYMDDWVVFVEECVQEQMVRGIENKLNMDAHDVKLPCLLASQPQTKVNERTGAHKNVARVSTSMSKDQMFRMVSELLEGYSTVDFQLQLQKLKSSKSGVKVVGMRTTRQTPTHIPGRSKLELQVQSQVLPKYGIPGTYDGDKAMRAAISPLKDDWMLQSMLWAMDVQLGKNFQTNLGWLLSFLRTHGQSAVQVCLTKVEVLSIAKELMEGFSSSDFQDKVQEFVGKEESAHDMPGRMELALSVQSKVLPRYGIQGTSEGVAVMLEAMLPYTGDEKLQGLHQFMLGSISPFMHEWMMLMDAVLLEDMLELIDDALDEVEEAEETEDTVDKFTCSEELEDVGKKTACSWHRQLSVNSETSTACSCDASDSPYLSESSTACPSDAPDSPYQRLAFWSEG